MLPRSLTASTGGKCECGGGCSKCASERSSNRLPFETETTSHNPSSILAGARAAFDFATIPVYPRGHLTEVPPLRATPVMMQRNVVNHSDVRPAGPWKVSEPSDPAEHEAKGIAEHLFPSSSVIGDADGARLVDELPPAGLAQTQRDGGTGAPCAACGSAAKLPAGVADRGSPLPAETRREMENAFGEDFAHVRIHTNAGAAQASRSLKAQAFTYGNDIFFDEGRYDPSSAGGKRLLAHELTHTVQQRGAIATLARQGSGRTTLQCVNDNLSSAGVASWLIGIVGATCGLIFGIAGSPTGPGAAGTAAFGAAVCIAGVIGFSVGAVLGVISGCWSDPNFKSRGAYLSSNAGPAAGASAASVGGGGGGAPSAAASPSPAAAA